MELERYDEEPVVFDDGAGLIKAGFASEDAPSVIFPPIIGRPKKDLKIHPIYGIQSNSTFVGDQAQVRSPFLTLTNPINREGLNNWEDMEFLWAQSFKLLKTSSEDQPLIIAEPSLNSHTNRERVTEVMFETFRVPSMYMATSSILSLYASGRSTGVVLDSGEFHTRAVPVCEGYPVGKAIQSLDFAGADLTDWMVKLLADEGFALYSTIERTIVSDMKEQLGEVELDFTTAMTRKKSTKKYILPDGNSIDVGKARFRCPEALFQPSLVGLEANGIHSLIFKAIALSEMDARRELFENVVLSGGSTMFPGIRDRLQKELLHMVRNLDRKIRVNVIAQPDRKYAVWMGGSILASLTAFQKMWISEKDYEEHGSSIIHSKPNQFYKD
jgi:actin